VAASRKDYCGLTQFEFDRLTMLAAGAVGKHYGRPDARPGPPAASARAAQGMRTRGCPRIVRRPRPRSPYVPQDTSVRGDRDPSAGTRGRDIRRRDSDGPCRARVLLNLTPLAGQLPVSARISHFAAGGRRDVTRAPESDSEQARRLHVSAREP